MTDNDSITSIEQQDLATIELDSNKITEIRRLMEASVMREGRQPQSGQDYIYCTECVDYKAKGPQNRKVIAIAKEVPDSLDSAFTLNPDLKVLAWYGASLRHSDGGIVLSARTADTSGKTGVVFNIWNFPNQGTEGKICFGATGPILTVKQVGDDRLTAAETEHFKWQEQWAPTAMQSLTNETIDAIVSLAKIK